MERLCTKCGTLVSGNGTFCPQCGAPMEMAVDTGSSVNLEKPASAPNPAPAPTYQQPAQGYQQPAQGYQQPAQSTPQYSAVNNDVMSVGQWVGTIILSGLGIIGVILLFVWAFSGDTPLNKKNYAKAMLILVAVGVGIYVLALIIMFAIGVGFSNELARY